MIVEQNIKATLSIVDRAIVMKMGGIIFDGASASLLDHEDLWSIF